MSSALAPPIDPVILNGMIPVYHIDNLYSPVFSCALGENPMMGSVKMTADPKYAGTYTGSFTDGTHFRITFTRSPECPKADHLAFIVSLYVENGHCLALVDNYYILKDKI
jgi:hypothetical protein